jgi:DNA-directed RNA polymerase subunit RPC12/RpoP
MPGTKICGKCGAKTALEEMEYSKDGTKLVCKDCLNKEKGLYTAAIKKPLEAPKPVEMTKYKCGHCQYSFSRKKDIEVKTCPYCSRDSISIIG